LYDLQTKPDPDTFLTWLGKGFGRTILFLQNHGSSTLRDTIFYAVSLDLCYDTQCEDLTEYLYRVIFATREPDYYLDRLLQALPELNADNASPWQVVTILRMLAEDGNDRARTGVLDAFERGTPADRLDTLEDLILLEGCVGVARAARLIDLSTIDENRVWSLTYPFDEWEERDGKDAVHLALDSEAERHPEIRPWMAVVNAHREDINVAGNRGSRKREVKSYEEIVELLAQAASLSTQKARGILRSAGLRASSSAIEKLADELACEEDPERAGRLVHLFAMRKFPNDPSSIIKLLECPDTLVAFSAMLALGEIQHPSLRPVALEYSQKTGCERIATSLLSHNLKEQDVSLLNEMIRRPMEYNDLHSVGIDVRDIAKNHPEIDCTEPVLYLYEVGKCGLCRFELVKYLYGRQELPGWMAEEIAHDAYSETRELAAGIARST